MSTGVPADHADFLENAPEYEAPPSPGLSLCDISNTFCRATQYDSFLVAVCAWATLQLTWTLILAASHLWQASRQMTTFEVSNLGRYGFMGGRGGQSLRDQSGAMKQAAAIGAGIGPSAAAEEATGGAAAAFGTPGPDGTALAGPGGPPPVHAHAHAHRHGAGGLCGFLKNLSAPLLRILGLDLFTKGKAMSGMARAGSGQNPFDMGFVRVSHL